MPVFNNKLNLVDFTRKFFTKNGRVYDFFDNCLFSLSVDGDLIKARNSGSYQVITSSGSLGSYFQSSPSIVGNDFAAVEFSRRSIFYNSSSHAVKISGIPTKEYCQADDGTQKPLAFSFWIKKTKSTTGTIFHAKDPQYDDGSGSGESADVIIYTKSDNTIGIEIRANGLKWAGVRTQNEKLKIGKWHYVVITYDGSVGLTMLGTQTNGSPFTSATGTCTGGSFSIYIDNHRVSEYEADRSVGGFPSATLDAALPGDHRIAEIFIGNDHRPGAGYWNAAASGIANPSNQGDIGGALSGSLANFNMWTKRALTSEDAKIIYNAEIFGARKLSSGMPNLPTKVHKVIECNLEDYPTVLRSSDKNRFGNENIHFNDNLTIELKDDELINFPTGLPQRLIENTDLNVIAKSPHQNSDVNVAVSGSNQRIYENYGKEHIRSPKVGYQPFNDTVSLDNDNSDLNGLSESIYPGFSSKYSSKFRIEIDITPSPKSSISPNTVGFAVPADYGSAAGLSNVFSAGDGVADRKFSRVMSYWNPTSKKWEGVGNFLHGVDEIENFDDTPGSFNPFATSKNWARKFTEMAAIGFSPGEGLTLAVTSSLSGSSISDSFKMAARPIDNFGFPHDAKYHAGPSTYGEQTSSGKGGDAGDVIRMSDYIQKPFLIEKVEWDVALSASIAYSSSLMYIEENPYVTGSAQNTSPHYDFQGTREGIFNLQSPFASSIATFFILKQEKNSFLDQDRFTRQTYLLDGKGRYKLGNVVTSSIPAIGQRIPERTGNSSNEGYYSDTDVRDIFTTRDLITYSQATFYYDYRNNGGSGEESYYAGSNLFPSLYACEKSYGGFLSGSEAENIPKHSGFLNEGLGREASIRCVPHETGGGASADIRRHYYFTGSVKMFGDCKITPPIGILDKSSFVRPDNEVDQRQYVPPQENFRGSTYPLALYGYNSVNTDNPTGRPRNTGVASPTDTTLNHSQGDHKAATLLITNLTWGGGRNPTKLSDPRSLVKPVPGNKFKKNGMLVFNPAAPFRYLGTNPEEPGEDMIGDRAMNQPILKPMESYSETSPYILMPEDEIVIGCQMGLPTRMSHLFTSSSQSPANGLFNRIESKGGSHIRFMSETPSKLVLYGSFISDGKEYMESLNQRLTTRCIHEDIKTESWPTDQFQLHQLNNLSGSYLDNYVTGSMKIVNTAASYEGVRGVARRYNVSKYTTPGNSPKTLMDSGSLQRHVVLVSKNETIYDSLIPDPRDIWRIDGVDERYYTMSVTAVGTIGYNFSTNSTLGSNQANNLWPASFPFEDRYQSVRRLATEIKGVFRNGESFVSTRGSATTSNNPSNRVIIRNLTEEESEIRNKYRSLFGFWRTASKDRYAAVSNGRNKWLSGEINSAGDPIYLASIAGYKYGLSNVVPTKTTACFRHDRYGQFRDMLEQRLDTVTQIGPGAGIDQVIKIKFIDRSTGLEIDAEETQSQNLTNNAASNVPYTEDEPKGRFFLTEGGTFVRVPINNAILTRDIIIS